MTGLRWGAALAVLALAVTLALPTRAADPAAEEQAIRALDAQWLEAVQRKDAAATAAFYAEDGAIMPSGAPASVGREAVAAAWAGFFGMPGFKLTFAPTRVVVAQSGDVAWEIGTYELGFDAEGGPVTDKGKYVVTWQKVDGAWLVGADIFNSDGPQ